MELREKIEYVLYLIREYARLHLSKKMTLVGIKIEDHQVFPKGAKFEFEEETIFGEEIKAIFQKLEGDGLIKDLRFWDDDAIFEIGTLDIDSDENPYGKSKSGTLLTKSITQKTDLDKGILALANGQVIHISGQTGNENNPLRLLKTLVKDIGKEWAEDEIMEDWEGVVAGNVNVPKDRIYQAYINLRKKVESQTGIQDLIGYRNKTYCLNSKYF